MSLTLPASQTHALSGGGEMGRLIRNHDWASTSVGAIDEWPQSLLTTLGIILRSRFPMFLWWGPDLLCFYNDAYRPSLGHHGKHPGILGMPAKDAWTETWAVIKPLIDQVLEGGEATWSEDQLIPIYRNGKLEDVYWTFSYSAVFDETAKPYGVLVTCSETTEKVKNLRLLKESKEQLEFAIDSTELGTWDLNPVTGKFTANKRLKEWFGVSDENEIELSDALAAISPDDRELVSAAIATALDYSSGGHYNITYAIIHPVTKDKKIVIAKGLAFFNEDQSCYSFNGTLQDITATYISNKKIQDSEQRVRALVQSAPFPIGVYTGLEMKIQMANQAILDVWGKGNDVIGKLYADILPELKNSGIYEQLETVYKTGEPYNANNQHLVLMVDGKPRDFFFNYNFKPLYDADGNIYGVMNTAADVTDLNFAKQQVEDSERNLHNSILHAPVAMCILKGETFIVEIANDRMLEFWGKTSEQVLSKPIFD